MMHFHGLGLTLDTGAPNPRFCVWYGAVLMIAWVLFTEGGRHLHVLVPAPFVILLAIAVLTASFAGFQGGLLGASIWTLYLLYAFHVHFGPDSLTGGWLQVLAGVTVGWGLMLIQGTLKDRGDRIAQSRTRLRQKLYTYQQTVSNLRESELRWRALLDNLHLIVVGLDAQGCVTYVNPFFLEMTGYRESDVLGQAWFDRFIPLRQRPDLKIAFTELLTHSWYPHYQNAIVTQTGVERLIDWNNSILYSPEGTPIGTLSIGEDMTDRSRLERFKAAGIAVVSHELRAPLTSIQAALHLLADELVPLDSDRARRTIAIATEGSDRLVTLINDILDFGGLDSGKLPLKRTQCNLADLMQQATRLMALTAQAAQITLVTQPLSISMWIDRDRILQVLINLLQNAIKFSPSGSTVQLSARVEPDLKATLDLAVDLAVDLAIVTVSDSGCGIPADQLEIIFEPFHQVDPDPAQGGTGLGLAICRAIVQHHGGRIWVESSLGAGSQFHISLPLQSDVL